MARFTYFSILHLNWHINKILLIALILLPNIEVIAQSKWNYHLGLGGELKSGNVNIMTLRNDGSVTRNDSLISLDAGYNLVYGKKDHEVYDKSLASHIKFDIWQYDKWSPFVSANYLNDKSKGYEYKLSSLIGVKYRIFSNLKCDYSISTAYVQDYTDYGNRSTTLKAMVSRLSLRFKMRHRINDYLLLKHTSFWQPSLMNPFLSITKDYIVSSTTSLITKINQHISLDLNFNYEYRSMVPDDVKKQDIISSVSLRIDF